MLGGGDTPGCWGVGAYPALFPQDSCVHVSPALQPLISQAGLTQPPAPLLHYIGLNQPRGGHKVP